jgi:8-oxo-dGTP pyrophosphatase MutT (NUDIX family)
MKAEPVDIYNENKEKTGKIKMRYQDKLDEGEYALAVKAIIVNSKNQILISKRAFTKEKNPGMWEINGGICLAGESSLQGIIREIKEELGIDLKNEKAILFKEYCKNQIFHDVWAFKLDIEIDKLKFSDREVEEAKWVSIQEYMQMEKEKILTGYKDLNYDVYKELLEIL